MCAKLRTVAAISNSRDHAPQSLYHCLFAPHINGVILHAHPVRGESHIQRKATGEGRGCNTIMDRMNCEIQKAQHEASKSSTFIAMNGQRT